LDHAQGGTILHRAAGIEKFQLRLNFDLGRKTFGDFPQTHQRGVTDFFDDGLKHWKAIPR
jgi:hypothetical protein